MKNFVFDISVLNCEYIHIFISSTSACLNFFRFQSFPLNTNQIEYSNEPQYEVFQIPQLSALYKMLNNIESTNVVPLLSYSIHATQRVVCLCFTEILCISEIQNDLDYCNAQCQTLFFKRCFSRSSRTGEFIRKGVLKISRKFTG